MAIGIRARLAITLVALVAVTVAAIGVGAYVFVDISLRARLLADARQQVDYDISVLMPGADPRPTDARSFAASGLPTAFALRGAGRVIADFGDGTPYEPDDLAGALGQLSPELTAIVRNGELGYAWQPLRDAPVLVVGGRQGGPQELYFVFSAAPIEDALAQLRVGLLAGGAAAIGVALLVAGIIARWLLRPVTAAARAARRIAGGDLTARVPEGGRDEVGRWAADFNRMADSLQGTIARLEMAQQHNRRFVADVAHELRTPLTALVTEASLIDGYLGDLPPDARRAAELLVVDLRRLRVLVDDLMEISRFDSDAERLSLEPVDLVRVVAGAVAARLPGAAITLPPTPLVVDSEPRRLDRILGNLLDNARDHAPGSPVEVALARTREGAVIVVAGRGPGVPADALPHLFDRFYKADPSRAGGTS
ncbi:MAG: HAMP domain-containing histidine kinase, partial [Chloroflexi bacterium]|nr:HAMP domain-containing histidine kinase [Chloroflexota bacterium]